MNWLRKPSTTGGIIYLICLGILAVGVGLVAVGQWRTGVTAMGACFGLAFVARLVLTEERAGMLAVRRRVIDLVGLAICASSLLILAATISGSR
ncbi:MAG: DUF3017 domain-containing protein [Nocardioidaceae bacterium]